MADLLTAKEIAEVLKMDQSHVYQLIKREMKHARIGRSVRVERSEFQRWLTERAVEPKSRDRIVKAVPHFPARGAGVRPSDLQPKKRTA